MNMTITTTTVTEAECCSAKVIQVIETRFARETGDEEDTLQIIKQYWSLDGELLAEVEKKVERSAQKMLEREKRRLEAYRQHVIMEAT